ncbi:MAG TPA: hypothetical protein VMZ22_05645 [Acidimicrobiales bacterium]|nr:hypothetical protein [Acidimicrobiales bacterium]
MSRPTRFEHNRFLGDKRSQILYDLDAADLDTSLLDDLLAAQAYVTFGPDRLAEARNRGYRLWKGHADRNPA